MVGGEQVRVVGSKETYTVAAGASIGLPMSVRGTDQITLGLNKKDSKDKDSKDVEELSEESKRLVDMKRHSWLRLTRPYNKQAPTISWR